MRCYILTLFYLTHLSFIYAIDGEEKNWLLDQVFIRNRKVVTKFIDKPSNNIIFWCFDHYHLLPSADCPWMNLKHIFVRSNGVCKYVCIFHTSDRLQIHSFPYRLIRNSKLLIRKAKEITRTYYARQASHTRFTLRWTL